MNKESEHSQPPQPPEIDRRLRLHPTQIIGALLLLPLPALALLGFFGESSKTMTVSDSPLEMRVISVELQANGYWQQRGKRLNKESRVALRND